MRPLEKTAAYLLEDAANYLETLYRRHRIPVTRRGMDPETMREAARALSEKVASGD